MASPVQVPPPQPAAFDVGPGRPDPGRHRAPAGHDWACWTGSTLAALVRPLLAGADHSLGRDQAVRIPAGATRRRCGLRNRRRRSFSADLPDRFRSERHAGLPPQLGRSGDHIDIDDEDFPMFGHNYTYDDQLQQAFPGRRQPARRERSRRGECHASEDDQIRVVVHKRINADNQQDADKWNRQHQAADHRQRPVRDPEREHAGCRRSLGRDGSGNLPSAQGIGSHFHATRRRQRASGRDGDVDITNQHGDVSATDINGKVNLNLDHGSARVSQMSRAMSPSKDVQTIVSIEDVKGAVAPERRIWKASSWRRSPTGHFQVLADRHGILASSTAIWTWIQATCGPADLIGPLRLTTRSKDIRLTGVIGDVRVQDENGSVELHMNKLGSMQVDNRKSDIQIYVPDKAAFQLDARARNGEIETDFDQLEDQQRQRPGDRQRHRRRGRAAPGDQQRTRRDRDPQRLVDGRSRSA